MEPLMIVLGALLALAIVTLISFFIVKNKRIGELESEIRLYRQLTSEESKNNDAMVFVANLNDYSVRIITSLNKMITQSYQRFAPKWSLDYFGIFLDELNLVNNQEKKDLIKSIFAFSLSLLDAKILADIITKHLKDEGNFDEKTAKDGLSFIMSVILKSGNAGQLATCFKRELKENIKKLLDAPEISADENILIQAGWIKIEKMLTA
ncbi:MAG: hypothetical protein WAW11_00870 [Patescibacteria group bacterium]